MLLLKKIPKIILLFFITDIILGIIYLLIYKFGDPLPKVIFRNILVRLTDLNLEANLAAWYSSIQLFCVSVLFGVFAYFHFEKNNYRSWLLALLPLIFLYLSADEAAEIHESIGNIFNHLLSAKEGFFRNTGIWMLVVGLPAVLIIIILIRAISNYFQNAKSAFLKLKIGFAVWVFAAIFIETLSNLWVPHTTAYVIEVFFEETGEMIGVTFMLWAAYDLLKKYNFKLSLNSLEEQKKEPAEKMIK